MSKKARKTNKATEGTGDVAVLERPTMKTSAAPKAKAKKAHRERTSLAADIAQHGKELAEADGRTDETVLAEVEVEAAKPAKAKKEPAPKEPKRQSPVAAMREILANNPEASVEEIMHALDQRGLSKPEVTVATIKSDFTRTFKALEAAGRIKFN